MDNANKPAKELVTPKSKSHKLEIIVDSQVRRSNRLQGINKGYKSSTCADRHCLACSATPPAISTKVIRSLGEQFCKIDPKDLTEEKLSNKRKTKSAIGAEKAENKGKKVMMHPIRMITRQMEKARSQRRSEAAGHMNSVIFLSLSYLMWMNWLQCYLLALVFFMVLCNGFSELGSQFNMESFCFFSKLHAMCVVYHVLFYTCFIWLHKTT